MSRPGLRWAGHRTPGAVHALPPPPPFPPTHPPTVPTMRPPPSARCSRCPTPRPPPSTCAALTSPPSPRISRPSAARWARPRRRGSWCTKRYSPPLPLLLRIPLPYQRCAPLPLSKRARRTTRSTSFSASPAARAPSPTPAGADRPPLLLHARWRACSHTRKNKTSGRRSGARRRYHDTLSFWHLEYFYWAESVFRLYNVQQAARPAPAALRFFGTLSEYRNARVRQRVAADWCTRGRKGAPGVERTESQPPCHRGARTRR